MSCAGCGRANRAESRFCIGCGKPLAPRCPACGAEREPDAEFCGGCGAALGAPAARADDTEARKIVTIVFADLIGSTSLHERLDPESVSRVMDRYHRTVRAPVEAHGGTVVQLLGDGVMCAFGVPRVAEDDAIRAVRAAVGIQRAFREFAREERAVVGDVGVRVAVNTGEVVVSDDYAAGIGDPLNVAARLQQEARDGEVLIGETTERLVRELVTLAPFGVLSLKGRAETVTAYRVVSLDRPAGAAATAFVGRDEELRRIAAVHDTAVAAPAARLAVILGAPGLGKSRLLAEFGRRLGDGATVLTARCDATAGATFAPIAEALRSCLRVDDAAGGQDLQAVIARALPGADADRARIAAGITALLGGTPALPEETFFVVRRFLAALAAKRPVVLAIDDLQWAESLLLDLLEHLVQWGSGVPLLVLAAARPDLRDRRSALATPGGLVRDVVTLGGLDASAATRLAANVIGAAALPAAIAGRVLATSEGNPLFVGELVRMLVNDGALTREGDRWTMAVDLAALEMPPTIHALLAARIERLRAEDRLVLERAAIVGRQFSRAAVGHLLPREAQGDLDTRLEALRRSELIESDATWFLGEPALRFHHGLTRDAAYRRVLKGTRADLHGRFADWIESRVAGVEGGVEHDETIGWHLEQAHQSLRELGPIDAHGRTLGDRAARYLAAAGRRALGRDDLPVAANLLRRALEQLDSDDPARADFALDWCEALLAAGDVGPAAHALDELGRFTDGSDRLRAWHTCFAGELAVLTDPQALHATATAVAAAADELAAADDDAGEAKAHLVHALALSRLGKVGVCEAVLDKALAAARRAHDRRRANTVLANAPLAALWGPSPVTRASGRCLDVVRVLRITQGAPGVEAVALRCQAVLEALRGRTEAARRMIASARRMVEELGITQQLLEADVFAGLIDLLEGDAAAAERCLRGAYDGLREHGLGIDAARAAAFLGRALLVQGRATEAEALSHESEALAGDDLQAAIAWRGVRAAALARRGEHASAVDFARAAVDIAATTDALLHHADARLALAVALRAGGRHDEAVAEEARAVELWEAKGATVLCERARRDLGRVEAVDDAADDRADPAPSTCRRARANAATANVARLDAAIAARDADALVAVFADETQAVNHQFAGVVFDRRETLATWLSLLRAQAPTCRHEPLATLGDAVALCRQWTSASGAAGAKFDVGFFEMENVFLIEVDAQGQRRQTEIFAADRLGDAVVRLYERYAELLPDGRARDRAAATARSVAAVVGPFHFDRYAAALSPAFESVDHRTLGTWSARGVEVVLQHFRALLDIAEDIIVREDEVLSLQFDAYLVRRTHAGTERSGGGAYERQFLSLWAFGADGLITRWEQFDSDRDVDAQARFDELTAAAPPARLAAAPSLTAERPVRRVPANAATAYAARIDAAIAARDADTFPMLIAEDDEVIDHSTGATYGRSGSLSHFRRQLRARDLLHRTEPLATLGDSLALCRLSVSGTGAAGRTFDVGAFDFENVILVEVDARGRRRRLEAFATRRLGDAVVRLYERYAELLPDGPARDRAAATARAVAALPLVGAHDLDRLDRWAPVLAPAHEYVDHRTVGVGPVHGAEEMLRAVRALIELSEDLTACVDDVLALRSDAFLVRWTHSGTDRASGGAFERRLCHLWVFGADGLVTRVEQFDAERDAEALARFDALAASPADGLAVERATAPSRGAERRDRRVRTNAATENAARMEAALIARDVSAFPTLVADDTWTVHHPTGAEYGVEGSLSTWRSLLAAPELAYRLEPLAALGDRLALCRSSASGSGAAGRTFDVGAYEIETILLMEVDAQERRRRVEAFAAARLGDAVARLYERYAELLPDGRARARAAATARSVATLLGPIDDDFWATTIAPAIEVVDHRTLGTFSGSGADALLQNLRSWLEIGVDLVLSVDDVLGLESGALLARRTFRGTDRDGGGAFERPLIQLLVFGAAGLATQLEVFDIDREAEALARFDALVPGSAGGLTDATRGVRITNAATGAWDRFAAAWEARDWERVAASFAPEFRAMDRRTMIRIEVDRAAHLESLRSVFGVRSSTFGWQPLATRGDRLVLGRLRVEFSDGDVGPSEVSALEVLEVDDHGDRVAIVVFDPDDLDAAYADLDARYAAGEAAPYARACKMHLHGARAVAARDWEQFAAGYARDCVMEDHRPLGFPTLRSRDECMASVRALADLRPDATLRFDHVLAFDDRRSFTVNRWVGSESEGMFEIPVVVVTGFDPDGRIERVHVYNPDQLDEARARFEELTAESPARRFAVAPSRAAEERARRVRPNAATRNAARLDAAVAARDAEALPDLFAGELEGVDHITHTPWDHQASLSAWRSLLFAEDPACRHEPLATLGESLALCRMAVSASGIARGRFDVGAYEKTEVHLIEADAQGRRRRMEAFAADRLGDAVVRLYERYAEILVDGPGRARAATTARSVAALLGPFDLDRYAAAYVTGHESVDHRILGSWSAHGAEAWRQHLRSFADLADHVTSRHEDILDLRSDALLIRGTTFGTDRAGGGAFENPHIAFWAFGADGLMTRTELFDSDREAEALARFDELAQNPVGGPARWLDGLSTGPGTTLRIENAATRASRRAFEAWQARDWERLAALFPVGFRHFDRRPLIRLELDRDEWLASYRQIVEMTSGFAWEVLATRGERLGMMRVRWEGADASTGPSEIESLAVVEVDGDDDAVAVVEFDPDDVDAAYAELDERYGSRAMLGFLSDVYARDWDAVAARFAPDLVVEDHRLLGWETLHGPAAYLEAFRALVELAPDSRVRVEHAEASDRGSLVIATTVGTREGGAFEIPRVVVVELDAQRRTRRIDMYDLDQLDAARARFAAIEVDRARDPLAALARPNAATAAVDRVQTAFEARDWAGVRAVCAPDARLEDRQRHAQVSGDIDFWIANLQQVVALDVEGLHFERRLAGTAGDRVCLERVLWCGGPADGRIEIEHLWLAEVDESGRLVAGIIFGPEDWRAAGREARTRWLARDTAAAAVMGPPFELVEGWNARDRARLRAVLAADVMVDDRRLTGGGPLDGADAYLDTQPVLWDLAPDIQLDAPFVLALEPHGAVGVGRFFGTLPEGGAFEIYTINAMTVARGRVTRIEIFEINATDAALARLAELRPDPLRIPPKAASSSSS